MATTELSPPARTPTPITSAQPGGGWCVRAELAWARFRRAMLRRFMPEYVVRMAALRQGECPGCPHDIIDSRDLKYARPVCGYWFRPEDDRFRWRDRVGLARHGFIELFLFSLLFGALTVAVVAVAVWFPWALIGLVPVLALWAFVIAFFRDPQRKIPTEPDLLVSPADGTITHLEEVIEGGERLFRVSIFLSIFNVHVNRSPRAARVVGLSYFRGTFLDARDQTCHIQNEQLWVDLEDLRTRQRIRVKQIAGAAARRIVCWLRPGDELAAGQRFGMIKFGSRTDVLVPAGSVREVLVKVGQPVSGGSTALLRMNESQ